LRRCILYGAPDSIIRHVFALKQNSSVAAPQVSSQNPDAIVGSRFIRDPPESTARYTRWANEITPDQLYLHAYTSHAPTVILPTWFFARDVFDRVGKFDESGKSTGEDLLFFFDHLAAGGRLVRIDDVLVTYRYHVGSVTFSVLESSIWDLRVKKLQERVLCNWDTFTIWNAGKQGRRLYRSLNDANRRKVIAFCDVHDQKIARGTYTYEESTARPKPQVPVVHFSRAQPPFIVCVKLDLTGGDFEQNLASLNLREGVDYFHFS
jgi:hypothetical protein